MGRQRQLVVASGASAVVFAPLVVMLVYPAFVDPEMALMAGRLRLLDAVGFGVQYALSSAAVQVVVGFSAYALLHEFRAARTHWVRVTGRVGELLYILPYLTPSAAVSAGFDWHLAPGGRLAGLGLRGPGAGFLELQLLSLVTLAPFTYLALRLREVVTEEAHMDRVLFPGPGQPASFLSGIPSVVGLLLMLFVFRTGVMLGKFDLPVLVGADPIALPHLVNIPVYLNQLVTSANGKPEPAVATAGMLVMVATIALLGVFVLVARLRERAVQRLMGGIISMVPCLAGTIAGLVIRITAAGLVRTVGVAGLALSLTAVVVPVVSALWQGSVEWSYLSALLQPLMLTSVLTLFAAMVGTLGAGALFHASRHYDGALPHGVARAHHVFYSIPAPIYFLAYWLCLNYLPAPSDRRLASVLWYGVLLVLLATPICYVLLSAALPNSTGAERVFRDRVARAPLARAFGTASAKVASAAALYLAVVAALVGSELFGAARLLEGAVTANVALQQLTQATAGDDSVLLIAGCMLGLANVSLCGAAWLLVRRYVNRRALVHA